MFFKKKNVSYSYIPSFEIKTKNRLDLLTIKYQDLFLKFIQSKKLEKKDEEMFSEGIREVSFYITYGIFYQLSNSYNSKTKAEQKLEALFNILKKEYSDIDFNKYIEEEILILAEDSIYESLGMKISNKDKTFYVTSETSNFIKYAKANLFFKVINLLEQKTNEFKIRLEENDEENEITEADVDEIFKKKNFHLCLPEDILIELKHAILTRQFPDHIRPYLEKMI